MKTVNFYDTLLSVLKQDGRFVSADGKFLRNAAYEAAMQMDTDLIHLLLSNETTKARLFKEVDGIMVFDKVQFGWDINNRQFLPDSYTRFKNKIGLADENGNMISSSGKVELVFPYKDCVLEGGQTKEDQKHSEIFYNEELAPDEIDRLLYPKVLVNAKRISAKGEQAIAEFSAADNLIIKGNNLLVLSSLLKKYEGKIKLIYIDPPYDTGNDSFGYNDKFNRSSWLTFMKNRLEIARKLLAPEGAIYVQLDYNQVHYAKVLMDEIFGEENFQREIIWRIGWVSGYKTAVNNYIRNHDTILFYSKDCNSMEFNKKYITNKDFVPKIKDSRKVKNDLISAGVEKEEANHIIDEINYLSRPKKYPIEDVWNGNEYDDLNSIAIVSFAGETVSKMLTENDEIKGQKSEKLIKRIIEAHTGEGDLILDFFGGSGTTAAVAHKMKRRYILCEQLESHIDIATRRLKKVIGGEQSGISKNVNWQGGGSFVYCELAKLNQNFVDEIQAAESDNELISIYSRIIRTGFISCKVNPSDISAAAGDYNALPFHDKKRFLMELLDKNLLYVNLCDMDDKEFNISEADKEFTRSFYGEV